MFLCWEFGPGGCEEQEEQQIRGARQQQQVSRQPVFVLDEETLLLSYVMNGRRYAANVTEQGFLHCCSCPHDSAKGSCLWSPAWHGWGQRNVWYLQVLLQQILKSLNQGSHLSHAQTGYGVLVFFCQAVVCPLYVF